MGSFLTCDDNRLRLSSNQVIFCYSNGEKYLGLNTYKFFSF